MNLKSTSEHKKNHEIITNFFFENFTLEQMENLNLDPIVDTIKNQKKLLLIYL